MTRNAYSDLSETQWRATVVALAEALGWRAYFVENSTREITRRSGPHKGTLVRVRNINQRGQGFPDLVLVRARDRRLIFAELKRDLGPKGGGGARHVNPTPEQEAWLADLSAAALRQDNCGRADHAAFEVYVWRPGDYDLIEEMLR